MATAFHHVGFVCKDPIAMEKWYAKYFGFRRARVAAPGPDQVVFLKRDDCYLEVFKATEDSPAPMPKGAGPEYPGWRHLAFKVDNIDDLLKQMGDDAHVTLGPMDFNDFIRGWRTVWVADPEGNIIEISQGYVDEENPPAI